MVIDSSQNVALETKKLTQYPTQDSRLRIRITLMRIRIQLLTFMRVRIQLFTLMRIRIRNPAVTCRVLVSLCSVILQKEVLVACIFFLFRCVDCGDRLTTVKSPGSLFKTVQSYLKNLFAAFLRASKLPLSVTFSVYGTDTIAIDLSLFCA
jgi:hypothetical protein